MFTDKIEPIMSNGAATICGKYIHPKIIGTIRWYWNDYEGKLSTNKLNNLIYFPDLQVNLLISTKIYESIKDD